MDKSIKKDDFLIRVRPFRSDDGDWNGDIDLSVVTLPDNDFNDEDYGDLIHFCTMMAATVPIMEDNEEIRNLVHEYVMEVFDTQYESMVEENKVHVEHEGNIVKIDFGTKTKGSA